MSNESHENHVLNVISGRLDRLERDVDQIKDDLAPVRAEMATKESLVGAVKRVACALLGPRGGGGTHRWATRTMSAAS